MQVLQGVGGDSAVHFLLLLAQVMCLNSHIVLWKYSCSYASNKKKKASVVKSFSGGRGSPASRRVKESGHDQAPPEPQQRQKTLTPTKEGLDQFLRFFFFLTVKPENYIT